MTADKAQEIIKRAMADPNLYYAMAARENELWGKILPERERSQMRRGCRHSRNRS
jgi:hypothetical protein